MSAQPENAVTRATAFLGAVQEAGYAFHAGVPCSLLKQLIRQLEEEPRWEYVSATREDSAIGMAAGAWLGGRLPAVYMQNSGLGVSINALQSLSQMYRLPLLLVISWRGEGGRHGIPAGSVGKTGFVDAPEHIEMGERMTALLDATGVPFTVLDPQQIARDVDTVTQTIKRTSMPAALIVRKGIFGD